MRRGDNLVFIRHTWIGKAMDDRQSATDGGRHRSLRKLANNINWPAFVMVFSCLSAN